MRGNERRLDNDLHGRARGWVADGTVDSEATHGH